MVTGIADTVAVAVDVAISPRHGLKNRWIAVITIIKIFDPITVAIRSISIVFGTISTVCGTMIISELLIGKSAAFRTLTILPRYILAINSLNFGIKCTVCPRVVFTI